MDPFGKVLEGTPKLRVPLGSETNLNFALLVILELASASLQDGILSIGITF